MNKKKQLKKILDRYPMLEADRNFINSYTDKTKIDINLIVLGLVEKIPITDD